MDGVVCCEAQAILLHREVKMILHNTKTSHLCNKSYRITVFIFVYLSQFKKKQKQKQQNSCMWIYFKYISFCQLANIHFHGSKKCKFLMYAKEKQRNFLITKK